MLYNSFEHHLESLKAVNTFNVAKIINQTWNKAMPIYKSNL